MEYLEQIHKTKLSTLIHWVEIVPHCTIGREGLILVPILNLAQNLQPP